MSALLVTVDLGNTSTSLRLWEAPGPPSEEPLARARVRTDDELPATVAAWAADVAPRAPVALSSVASVARTREVVAALEAEGRRVQAPPDPGLELRVRRAETVGQDRLFAARAAAEHAGGRCLVVDAGTALTVDAVGWTPERPVFLGGAIAPGPELLADALHRGTGRLPRVEPRPGARALGRDTEEALQAGIAAALRGAARELVRELAACPELAAFGAADEPVPLFLVGGAVRHLLEPTPVWDEPPILVPDLVHHGLWLAARP